MNNFKRNLIGKDKLLHSKVGNCMLVLFFVLFFKFWSVGAAFVLALAAVLLAGEYYALPYCKTYKQGS